jgi:glycosyltransferase involved in cell wall biosynthesis
VVARSDAVEPIVLARVGFPTALEFRPHLGTPFGVFDGDGSQYRVFTEISDFDSFNLTLRDKGLLTDHLEDFLLAHRPDVIHVHSTLYLGIDLLSFLKKTLPDTRLVHTLYDYRAICHRDGVMVRTLGEEVCDHYSPRRCNECFPDIAPPEFFMRKRYAEAHFAAVDLFLAPTRFLLERYVDWGIPPEKIQVSELGHDAAAGGPPRPGRWRDRLGFFGGLNRHDGVIVLLEAMKLLGEESAGAAGGGPDPRLRLHGEDLEWQPWGLQDEVRRRLASTGSSVRLIEPRQLTGSADPMAEVDWVVVPSLWWEGPPLAVGDAFAHGKPVICSGIGSLKERVGDGVNGLHFRRGDAGDLAATIRRAVGSEGLWEELRAGIPPVRSVEEEAGSLIEAYRELEASKALRS